MKLKPIYTLIFALAFAACSSAGSSEESNDASTEEVVEIPVGEVTYMADTTSLKGYFAVPEAEGKRPGVLVIHEWWGHNEHSRERADMLAGLGYVAFALDMYGDGKNTNHPNDANNFMMSVVSNMDLAKSRFESAMEQLKNHPMVDADQIGIIGFCFGGTMALTMASDGYDIDAVAAFHAGLQLPIMPDSAGTVKAKILIANGADDPMISDQQVQDFKAVMDASEVDYKYIAYEGAVHAFTNKGADEIASKHEMLNGALAYNAAADSASWEEMKVLFSSVFK